MIVNYDQAKSDRNRQQRGLPFDLAFAFDFDSAVFEFDLRRAYKERRVRALGKIGTRVHMLVFKPIPGGIRVISLRKANSREVKRYEAGTRP